MNLLTSGIYIVLEGPDGSGKGALAGDLTRALTDASYLAVLTREPWGSGHGKSLRGSLAAGALDPESYDAIRLAVQDRTAHESMLVGPAMDAGCVVVGERSWPTTIAYNMAGDTSPAAYFRTSRSVRVDTRVRRVLPHLIVYLKTSPELSYERTVGRIARRGGAEAVETLDTARRVCRRYDDIFANEEWFTPFNPSSARRDDYDIPIPVLTLDTTAPLHELRRALVREVIQALADFPIRE